MKNGLILSLILIFFAGCAVKDAVDDTKATIALKDVQVESDTLFIDFDIPYNDTTDSGKTLDTLIAEDSAKYKNPENYTITFSHVLSVDNSKSEDQEARFSGLKLELGMNPSTAFITEHDNDTAEAVTIEDDGFTVQPQETVLDTTSESINLKTHRITGLYIFTQIADGKPIDTDVLGSIKLELGSLNTDLKFLNVENMMIPTRASDETKTFLRSLVDSDLFKKE